MSILKISVVVQSLSYISGLLPDLDGLNWEDHSKKEYIKKQADLLSFVNCSEFPVQPSLNSRDRRWFKLALQWSSASNIADLILHGINRLKLEATPSGVLDIASTKSEEPFRFFHDNAPSDGARCTSVGYNRYNQAHRTGSNLYWDSEFIISSTGKLLQDHLIDIQMSRRLDTGDGGLLMTKALASYWKDWVQQLEDPSWVKAMEDPMTSFGYMYNDTIFMSMILLDQHENDSKTQKCWSFAPAFLDALDRLPSCDQKKKAESAQKYREFYNRFGSEVSQEVGLLLSECSVSLMHIKGSRDQPIMIDKKFACRNPRPGRLVTKAWFSWLWNMHEMGESAAQWEEFRERFGMKGSSEDLYDAEIFRKIRCAQDMWGKLSGGDTDESGEEEDAKSHKDEPDIEENDDSDNEESDNEEADNEENDESGEEKDAKSHEEPEDNDEDKNGTWKLVLIVFAILMFLVSVGIMMWCLLIKKGSASSTSDADFRTELASRS